METKWKQIALKRSGAPINILASITGRSLRVMVITNVSTKGCEESPYCAKVTPHRWVHAIRGAPFTGEEIRELREEYQGAGNAQT